MGARHAGRHGPIALVDEGELVVFIMPLERGRDVLHAKVRSGIEEVRAEARSSSPSPNRATGMMNVMWMSCSGIPNARR